ncbi:MAG: DUF805 domain-containing protein [Alcanivoracaceae bacterium]
MMDQDSPYSPPRSGLVGKGHIIYEEVRPLALGQRLNRLRYACYQLTSVVILMLTGVLGAVLVMGLSGGEGATPAQGGVLGVVTMVLLVVMAIAGMGYWVILAVRRLHDLGRSGWLCLLFLSPLAAVPAMLYLGAASLVVLAINLINPLLMLYLFAAAGESGMNRYGTPNPPNGILVQIFGGIWWALCVFGALLTLATVIFMALAPDFAASLGINADQGQAEVEALRGLMGRF